MDEKLFTFLKEFPEMQWKLLISLSGFTLSTNLTIQFPFQWHHQIQRQK